MNSNSNIESKNNFILLKKKESDTDELLLSKPDSNRFDEDDKLMIKSFIQGGKTVRNSISNSMRDLNINNEEAFTIQINQLVPSRTLTKEITNNKNCNNKSLFIRC